MSRAVLPDAEARARALDLSIHALVMAPAGSGKTGLLVHRMLRALATVDAPEQVVAITFTNKAAAEIRARLLEQLHAAQITPEDAGLDEHERALRESARAVLAQDQAQGWNLLAQPGRLSALTIDAFCAQIAAQLPLLSGLGGAMRVAEDPRLLYEAAIARLFEEIEDASVPAADRDALARVLRLSGNRLDRLIEPLCGLLARREQWLQPSIALGPQDWSAQDAQALAALIEPALRAFAACFDAHERHQLTAILREGSQEHALLGWAAALDAWPATAAAQLPSLRALAGLLLTQDGTLRKQVTVRQGFHPKRSYTQRFKDWLAGRQGDADLERAAVIVRALPDPQLPEALIELRRAWLRVLRRLAAHLRLSVADTQQADFPELAQAALAALRPEGAVGEALLAADRRIRHLLVDEMQDTSEMQVELIERLTCGWSVGDGRSLFLVGDPQQSIYAFRKAEVRLFLNLWQQSRLRELPLVTLRLSANFRSQPAVVDWFNRAFQTVFPRHADIQRGAVAFSPSVPLRAAESGPVGVQVRACADLAAEAEAMAADAARLIAPDRSVVVLARARAHLEPLIRALRARGLTPACQDIDPLAALPEVRDLIALARALWHPQDRLSWAVLLRAPFVGLSWADLVALSRGRVDESWPQRIAQAQDCEALSDHGRARLQALQQAMAQSALRDSLRVELADRVEAVWTQLGGPACCSRPALDDVREALQCLRSETRGGGIRDLDALTRRLAALYAAPQAGQVQLMTVHKAKGLEFDHVLLAGLNRGTRSEDKPPLHLFEFGGAALLVPRPDEAWGDDHPAHRSYDALQALHVAARGNETLRLLYVAITRAKRSATLYLSAARDPRSQRVKLKSNSFAGALEPVILADVEQQIALQADAVVAPEADHAAPTAARLRDDWTLPQEEGLYRPQETRTARPSEAVLSSQEEPDARRDEGDLYAQLLGTLYHEAMQRVAVEGLAAWADGGQSRRHAMAAGLRRRGMPEPGVEPAVTRVIELLGRTLASDTGRWLVSPKPWSRSEYPLAGRREGRWISAVIDRCFEDDTGVLWVIDYKTRAQPLAQDEAEAYVQGGAAHYRGQIEQYVQLLADLRPGREVRGALYFAELDRLVEIRA